MIFELWNFVCNLSVTQGFELLDAYVRHLDRSITVQIWKKKSPTVSHKGMTWTWTAFLEVSMPALYQFTTGSDSHLFCRSQYHVYEHMIATAAHMNMPAVEPYMNILVVLRHFQQKPNSRLGIQIVILIKDFISKFLRIQHLRVKGTK